MIDVGRLLAHCEEGVSRGVFPGAAFAVGSRRASALAAVGRHTYDPDSPLTRADSLFDLASLTKVVATTSAAMVLADEGLLDIDETASRYVQEFESSDHHTITIRQLLLHTSGLPDYSDFRAFEGDPAAVRGSVLGLDLVTEPGTETAYSCIGFVALQTVLETVAGQTLSEIARARVFEPLRMRSTRYNPPREAWPSCVPTEDDHDWRKRLLRGEVHDPIAYLLGGVSGNAGLFSTAEELAIFARFLLGGGVCGGRRIVRDATVREWTRKQSDSSTRALGWDTRSEQGSSAGSRFSTRSFGHTGYTGVSIWIDPENGLFAVLLTNRIHPSVENEKIAEFRPRFHDLAFEALSD